MVVVGAEQVVIAGAVPVGEGIDAKLGLVALAVAPVSVSVTGQTVVLTATVSVVTWPAGQFVTVGAQDVTVYSVVV